MKLLLLSKALDIADVPNTETTEIHVFTQFFVHKSPGRNEEMRHCLKQNQQNPHVTAIHLLGEREYNLNELGLETGHKIVQENVEKRLTFQAVFQYIREKKIKGYCVMTNADIFFDDTIKYLKTSTLHEKKEAVALLRYEFNKNAGTDKSPIFGPRFDSQDTWILHSNYAVRMSQEKIFNFEFGKPGCDNKMVYLLRILGYGVINDPNIIKSFHFHRSIMRDYFGKEVIAAPWGTIVPAGYNPMSMPPSLGINAVDICRTSQGFQYLMYDDHVMLYDYIAQKLQRNEPFVIPRIAGIENNFAVFAKIKQQTGRPDFDGYFQQVGPAMKTNAGVLLSNWGSVMNYSATYLKAFDNCELYSGWEIQGEVHKHIAQSHDFIRTTYPTKRVFWAFALDIFHYVYDPKAWTKSLQGKRILVISPFIESIREKVPLRTKLFDGVDLFPECKFVYIKPPMTQAGEPCQEFDVELLNFTKRLDELRDQYDVALVSCGGYGNPVCNYIFEKHGKSAVYVGGVLQMYFGVLGARWLKERPDAVRLFLNEHWSRPKVSERPANCEAIEKGCYW